MKTVCLYHPPLADNPNDQLIVEAFIELLKKYAFTIRHCLFGQDLPNAHALIVCGTPWIFDRCGASFKINELARVIDAFAGPAFAVGIGSSFPLGADPAALIGAPDVAVWRRFDRIAVRDRTARDLLESFGITSDRLACPAMLAPRPRYKPQKNKRLLVHAAGAPIPPDESFDTVIGLTQADADDAWRRGLRPVHLVSDINALKYEIGTCSKLTASRVHTCIFAHRRPRLTIRPIAVDTRMTAFTELDEFEIEKKRLETWFHETLDPHLG